MKINILDKNYSILLKLHADEFFKQSINCEIRSLQFSVDNKNIIIGTFGSEIWEISTKDAKISISTKFTGVKNLMRGHYTPNKKSSNEIWGLSTFASDSDYFATCSDDSTLRIWSVSNKKMLKVVRTNLDNSGQVFFSFFSKLKSMRCQPI